MKGFDFRNYCRKCGFWCCKGENPFASARELSVLRTKSITKKEDGSCIFLVDGLCSRYNNRPFECRIFPFDIQEIDGNLWWVLWNVCPAKDFLDTEEFIDGFEKDFQKVWSSKYLKGCVSFHKLREPEKYSRYKFGKLRKVSWH